jgi:hypothetical protein
MPEYKPIPFPFHAVYPHGRYLSAKVKTFVDFLVAWFERSPSSRNKQVTLEKDYSIDDLRAAI